MVEGVEIMISSLASSILEGKVKTWGGSSKKGRAMKKT